MIVCIGVMVMRKTNPDLPRPYKTPLVPLVPILGVLVCLAMMDSLDWITWDRLVVWLAIGLAIYFTYSRHHSHLRRDTAAGKRPWSCAAGPTVDEIHGTLTKAAMGKAGM